MFCAALAVVALLFGSVPFLTLPTLGQSYWISGFAESLARSDWSTLHATHFGLPRPAPVVFGLPGVWVQSLFIRVGAHPIDAYSMMYLFWLAVALWGATDLARRFGARDGVAWLFGVCWLTQPVVYWHAGYSMLAIGFALLPFYFGVVLRVVDPPVSNWRSTWMFGMAMILIAVLALFMDGYSYMLFVAAMVGYASLLAMNSRESRRHILTRASPWMVGSVVAPYFVYTAYVGGSTYERESLDLFRAFGVDLTMLIRPTKHAHWLWDQIGFSAVRPESTFYGDASVHITTFLLPLVLLVLIAALWRRRIPWRAWMLMLIAGCSLYLSLGPSLKVNSTRPTTNASAADVAGGMPAGEAIGPTGNAWLFENLPGFKNMRATYRWIGLTFMGLWGALVILSSLDEDTQTKPWLKVAMPIALFLMTTPNLYVHTLQANEQYAIFKSIDELSVGELRAQTHAGDRALFIPVGNDFVVSYLAPRVDLRTFNTGGDKNLRMAQQYWPESIRRLLTSPPSALSCTARGILRSGDADVLVLTPLDLGFGLSSNVSLYRAHQQVLAELEKDRMFAVHRGRYFSSVTLSNWGRAHRYAPGTPAPAC
jgi:hypothetical protein